MTGAATDTEPADGIVVAGGGIGGLACALALADAGHDVTVVERRDDFTEMGAGIQIAPNGFAALAALGVHDDVLAGCVRIDELVVRDGSTGERVVGLETDERYRARFGYPYAVVRRDDLYRPLLAACQASPRVRLQPATALEGYRSDARGVRVRTRRAGVTRVLHANLLVGADGLRSAVRRQVVGDGSPRASGHTIYRSVADMSLVPPRWRRPAVTLFAGDDWHLVCYPISGGRLLNLAITHDDGADREVIGAPVPDAVAHACLSGAHPQARELATLGSDWRSWVLCDRAPTTRWTDGRTLLVGDAAHPMLQYAAQGASMALEDAVALRAALGRPGDVTGPELPGVLESFARRRQQRTGVVQDLAVEMGRQVFHGVTRPVPARNAWLRSYTRDRVLDAVDWLHGGPATERRSETGARPAAAAARAS